MKNLRWIMIFIFFFFSFYINCYASVNTYQRSVDNLLVPDDVEIDSSHIQDVLNTPAVAASEKIYDFADLYDDNDEFHLMRVLYQFIEESGIDAVIVTTRNLNDFIISDYGAHFYDYNDFRDEGVLFVIYLGNYEPQIFIGKNGKNSGKVFETFTDERIQQISQYIYPDIKNENYYMATQNYLKLVRSFWVLEHDGNYRITESGEVVKELPWILIIIVSFGLTVLIMLLLYSLIRNNNKIKLKDNLYSKIDSSTLSIQTEKETLEE